jgi:MYXO-CTERM domain-containing protein
VQCSCADAAERAQFRNEIWGVPMLKRLLRRNLIATASVAGFGVCIAASAQADVPAGYLGTPFDPAMIGGAGIIPPTVQAGPYAIPGRIDLVNYDMGGDGVGYHSEAHYTTKGGDGYRTDRPTTTLCLTAPSKPDLWYDTGTAQDGMAYPGPAASAGGSEDFYIGSIHPGDWFNYTVNVQTAGTYSLSANFSTGNGPPGGEGGDGDMEVIVFANEVQLADWHEVFPDFQNKANFHNWKPYPNFAMIPLEAGLQVIKIQLPFKHLNLDYIQFDLMGAGGSSGVGGSGAGGSGGSPSGGAEGLTPEGGGGGASSGGMTSAGGAAGGLPSIDPSAGSATGGSSSAGQTASGTISSAGTSNGGPASAGAGTNAATGSGMMSGASTMNPDVNTKSGCAYAAADNGGTARSSMISGLLLIGAALRRRRRA